jgi:hypothetical protein
MDWLRKIVSGKRNRFTDDNYNLDITYITKRVIAMSFPASGLETMYRNSMQDVKFKCDILIGCQFSQRETWKELSCFQHEWQTVRYHEV